MVLTVVIVVAAVPFALAFGVVFEPINGFVRASVISVGATAIVTVPLSVKPESDLAGLVWLGLALWAIGGWLAGAAAGVLARSLLRWRRDSAQQPST